MSILANEVTSADGAEPLRFAFLPLRRATAEFFRSATIRFITLLLLGSGLVAGCQRSVRLPDVATIPTNQREMAQSNWGRVQEAFEAHDDQALRHLLGGQVLIHFETHESPWIGKAFAAELRELTARERAWSVPCKIDFTRKQVNGHFMWPDAVFAADFEVLGTLTSASISDHQVRIKPIAIQSFIFQL